MRYHINRGFIEAIHGDLTEQETDAIVNAANNLFWMGGGVAGAIKRRGGEEIEREAMAQGPVSVGASIITSGGKLNARFVIHAAVMGQDLHTDASKIVAATRSALTLADGKHLVSISFPALGTGVGGFSVYHCAKLMAGESIEFLTKSVSLRQVHFVLFDQESFDAFTQELSLQFSSKRH